MTQKWVRVKGQTFSPQGERTDIASEDKVKFELFFHISNRLMTLTNGGQGQRSRSHVKVWSVLNRNQTPDKKITHPWGMLKPTSHPLLWFKWPPHVYTRIHISAVNVQYCVLLSGDITSLRVIGFESLKKKAASCNTHKNSLHNITTFIPYWVPMGTTCTSKQFFSLECS